MKLQDNELYTSGMASLSAAMDKIKFNGSMTPADCEKVRSDIGNARASFAYLFDGEPDSGGLLDVITNITNLLEKAVNVADGHSHLI